MSGPPLRGHGLHLWLGSSTGVVAVTVALFPLALVVAGVLARRRAAAGTPPARAWVLSLAEVGIVYGTAPFVWMTMLPGSPAGRAGGAVSLVPLRDLATMSTFQVVGNLLIFAALGFLGPVRFRALRSVARVTALAAGCSAMVETAQYVLPLGRVSSVDDVLLNASGAGAAALLSTALLRGVALLRWWGDRRRPATGPCSRRGQCSPRSPGPNGGRSPSPCDAQLVSACTSTTARAAAPTTMTAK